MDVRVQIQAASPGVQRQEYAGLCAQVARIGEQLEQRVACGGEQCTHHRIGVEHPQDVEFVRNGEHHVPVRALDQTRTGAFEPTFFGQTVALGTGAVATRVVPHALEVSVGAALHVAAQLGGAAHRQGACGAILWCAQCVAAKQTIEVFVEKLLYRDH